MLDKTKKAIRRTRARAEAIGTVIVGTILLSPAFAQSTGTNPLVDVAEKTLQLFEGIALVVVAIGTYKIGIEYMNGGSMSKDQAYKLLLGGGMILAARGVATFIGT